MVDDKDNHAKFNYKNLGIKINYVNGQIKNLQHLLLITNSENKNSDFNENIIQNITTSDKRQIRLVSSYNWENVSQRTSLLLEKEDERFKQEGIVYDYGEYGIFDPNQERKKSSNSLALEHRGDINDSISYAISTRYDDNSEFNNSNTSRIEFIYNTSNNYRIRRLMAQLLRIQLLQRGLDITQILLVIQILNQKNLRT